MIGHNCSHATISLHTWQYLEDEQQALKRLKNDNNIVMLPADKGRVTVVMDKTDYFDKMDALVNDDKQTYKELKGLITWRTSARAEIISLGAKYEIACEES